MVRSGAVIVALLIASPCYAQNPPAQPVAKHAKHAKSTKTPTVQKADEPDDIAAVPANVQKWMGGAVDDILTGADKALGEGNDKR